MTAANERKHHIPTIRRPIILSPWLVAVLALVLYGVTLNHWVTFNSLPFAAQLSGWDWHPGPLSWRPTYQYPLFLILTLPLRLLPVALRPLGLNILTAVLAALTLAMLARSVRLFSHDRTKEQRLREGGEHAMLSVRMAFLPPAFAALMLAGQLTFWQNSVSGTEEMMDLAVFAFLILSMLEYRISHDEWRLNLFAFVYGVGVTNSWALIAFFPVFLIGMIWRKRADFFQWGFVLRMLGWGVLGLLFYGLIPLLGALHGDGNFWELVHQKMVLQKLDLQNTPRFVAIIAGVPTLVPLLFAAVNWPSFEGEVNAGAHNITLGMFRVLHIAFLAVGLLMFFDVTLSPSPRGRFGFGSLFPPGFLTFYYLAALSVGYFSGYVLLVFGRDVSFRWGQARGALRLVNSAVVGALCVTAIGVPAALFYENYPHIRDYNSPTVRQFADNLAHSLPSRPTIVLADDRARLYLAMGATQRLGTSEQYTFIESPELIHRDYLRYLANRYPAFRRTLSTNVDALPPEIGSLDIGQYLSDLSDHQSVYYLQPSFGTYFERVCMTPDRMGGDLHPYPSNVLASLILTREQIATNQNYWNQLEKESLGALPALVKTPANVAHVNGDAVRVASYYSQALDYWGTQLQRAGTEYKVPALTQEAGEQFAEALLLNPDNLIAKMNLQFNTILRGAPKPQPYILSSQLAENVSSWDIWYNRFGPLDVPDLQIQVGRSFALSGNYLQAAHIFQRSLELAPSETVAMLDLAKTYLDLAGTNLAGPALDLARRIPEGSGINPMEIARVEALAYFKMGDYQNTDRTLTSAFARDAKDDQFAKAAAEFYSMIGYRTLRSHLSEPTKVADAEKASAVWFGKSLKALDLQLRLISDNSKISESLPEINNVKLRKAEMEMMTKDYPSAITNLTAVITEEPDNLIPLLNRAISELQNNRLDAAKSDYQKLEKRAPEPSYMVYFGLAQIAQKQADKAEEVKYTKLYLQYAPKQTTEYANVSARLKQLGVQ